MLRLYAEQDNVRAANRGHVVGEGLQPKLLGQSVDTVAVLDRDSDLLDRNTSANECIDQHSAHLSRTDYRYGLLREPSGRLIPLRLRSCFQFCFRHASAS